MLALFEGDVHGDLLPTGFNINFLPLLDELCFLFLIFYFPLVRFSLLLLQELLQLQAPLLFPLLLLLVFLVLR